MVLDHAKKDEGVRESPPRSNRGKRVEEMLAVTGLDGGFPWCAAAVACWGSEALGNAWPVPRTADCDVLLAWGKSKRVEHLTPEPGDIFLRLSGTDSRDAQHTGFVAALNADGSWESIEGNTNPDGGAEGDGVYQRTRGTRSDHCRYRFMRWADLLESPPGLTLTVGSASLPVTLLQGRGYTPLRATLQALFPDEQVNRLLGWDADSKRASWAGAPVTFECYQSEEGLSLAPIRPLASWLGLEVREESTGLRLARPGAEEPPKAP